jgi:hypothetical protein
MGANGLSDVFVEWGGLPADDPRTVPEIEAVGCFELHGVRWQESFIAHEGRRRICHFRAPDAESVRIAFRQAGIRVDQVWSGTMLRRGDGIGRGVAVEWAFEPPWPEDPERALERAAQQWLEPLGLEPVRVIVPSGRRRIICFCTSPAEPRLPAPAWTWRHVAPKP